MRYFVIPSSANCTILPLPQSNYLTSHSFLPGRLKFSLIPLLTRCVPWVHPAHWRTRTAINSVTPSQGLIRQWILTPIHKKEWIDPANWVQPTNVCPALTDAPTDRLIHPLAVGFEVFVVTNTNVAFGTQRLLVVIDMRIHGRRYKWDHHFFNRDERSGSFRRNFHI